MPEPTPAPVDPITPPAEPGPAPAPAPVEPPAPGKPAPSAAPGSDSTAKLQSQRDKLQNEVRNLQAFLEPIAVERAAAAFLKDNQAKYPDLTADDFTDVPDISPEYLEAHASRLQTRLQEHAQKTVLKIENPPVPTQTLEEKNAELEKMRKEGNPGTFQRFIQHAQSA